jgi:hypothetical protein
MQTEDEKRKNPKPEEQEGMPQHQHIISPVYHAFTFSISVHTVKCLKFKLYGG